MDTFDVTAWPVEKLRWRPLGVCVSGGPTLSGPGQDAAWDGGGWWSAELEGIDLGDALALRAMRALLLQARGGVKRWIVPMLDEPLSPALALTPDSDGAPFSDGSLYVSGAVIAELAASAALRATTLQIRLEPGTAGPLLGGETFTIVHPDVGPRIYSLAEIMAVEDDVYTVFALPPLRQAASAGDPCDFNAPRCVMKLEDPGGEAWPWVGPGWDGKTTLRFVEAFDNLTS